jgi:hypothetical protein
MMQTFRISDALRCVLLNTPKVPNLAGAGDIPYEHSARQNLGLWKQVLTQRDNRITLAWWNGSGIQLGGLVSARTRAGRRVWEIDHFYLPAGDLSAPANGDGISEVQEKATLELLEQLIQLAGCRSAERIFFRLPSNNPAICLAQRTGFFPYFEEILMEGAGRTNTENDATLANNFRVRQPEDEYPLFQLFSATTPVTAREALGLTFDQWRDAQEPCTKGRQEWLRESNGKIVGWLELRPRRNIVEGRLMARLDYPDVLSEMVSFATSNPGTQRWLVPNYQGRVCDQLRYRGFQEMARYTMLVKTVAAPVMQSGMAPVEA